MALFFPLFVWGIVFLFSTCTLIRVLPLAVEISRCTDVVPLLLKNFNTGGIVLLFRRGGALPGRLVGSKRGSLPPGASADDSLVSNANDDSVDGEEENK